VNRKGEERKEKERLTLWRLHPISPCVPGMHGYSSAASESDLKEEEKEEKEKGKEAETEEAPSASIKLPRIALQ
jgi:hypothetical protein